MQRDQVSVYATIEALGGLGHDACGVGPSCLSFGGSGNPAFEALAHHTRRRLSQPVPIAWGAMIGFSQVLWGSAAPSASPQAEAP